jgi:hypothetical protein
MTEWLYNPTRTAAAVAVRPATVRPAAAVRTAAAVRSSLAPAALAACLWAVTGCGGGGSGKAAAAGGGGVPTPTAGGQIQLAQPEGAIDRTTVISGARRRTGPPTTIAPTA